MPLTLYELPIEANAIEAELYESCGELTPELENRIQNFVLSGKDKIEAAAVVIGSLESDAEICQTEAKRLITRASQLHQSADKLRNLTLFAVDIAFSGKLKTSKFTIWGQTSGAVTQFELREGADIYQIMATHSELIRVKEPELDKIALKEALKSGAEIPKEISVVTLEGKRFLRIK